MLPKGHPRGAVHGELDKRVLHQHPPQKLDNGKKNAENTTKSAAVEPVVGEGYNPCSVLTHTRVPMYALIMTHYNYMINCCVTYSVTCSSVAGGGYFESHRVTSASTSRHSYNSNTAARLDRLYKIDHARTPRCTS